MPRNHYELLRRSIHSVDQDTEHDTNDKIFQIKPVLEAVRKECVKVEPEEFHAVDKQIIPSKTKCSKVQQYDPQKNRKWGFKNLVRVGAGGFMYNFYLCGGKESNEVTAYSHLQKSAQVVAKLCVELLRHVWRKVFFDNWFTTLDLMIYLKKERLLAVGTIRSNRLQGCLLPSNKDLQKSARGASDYRVDNNSGIIIVKWLDKSVVQLSSNYVGIEPIDQIEKWDKTACERKNVDFPQIVKAYNKSMGGVDLVDMLIALYRISVKTKRLYIKVCWHLVNIAKVNGWILYKGHRVQLSIPQKEKKHFLISHVS